MHTISAKVIEDSISPEGKRLTTMQLCYPRFIHAEAKTHRVLSISGEEYEQIVLTQDAGFMSDPNLSRNASSSRAIPVATMIEQVRTNPAMPVHWGKNQPGMQAHEELEGIERQMAIDTWIRAVHAAADFAEAMQALKVHKQVANRGLETYQWIHVIVTATEWENFFALRDHPDAQPEIRALAQRMKLAMDDSTPKLLKEGDWHLPYVTQDERNDSYFIAHPEKLCAISAARCARVSYLTHDGAVPDLRKDLALYDRLVGSVPLHASPVEHQATPDSFNDTYSSIKAGWQNPELHGNLVGWLQFRKTVELSFN